MVDRLTYGLGEHVVAAVFSNDGTLGFALGDGSLRLIQAEAKEPITAPLHEGAILFAAPHPKQAFLTAGDDGRLVASDGEGKVIAEAKGKGWPSAMAVDRERGRIAVAFSRNVKIFDSALTLLGERQAEATVQGLAFEPNGRRLGAAMKDGATLWPVEGKGDAQLFKWKGAHSGLTWSPDRRFIVSTMLENALHGWRIADKADMRMSGYPAKVKSVSWEPRGRWLATSGADVIVLWPFSGPEGPMGKSPREITGGNGRLCTRVEWHPNQDAIAAGYDDGRVLVHILGQPMARQAAAETGSPVTTLSWAPDGKRLAAGREDGSAVLLSF